MSILQNIFGNNGERLDHVERLSMPFVGADIVISAPDFCSEEFDKRGGGTLEIVEDTDQGKKARILLRSPDGWERHNIDDLESRISQILKTSDWKAESYVALDESQVASLKMGRDDACWAEAIICVLSSRLGFSSWWESIDDNYKVDIMKELLLISTKVPH